MTYFEFSLLIEALSKNIAKGSLKDRLKFLRLQMHSLRIHS